MSTTTTTTSNTTGPIAAGDVELYVDQRGSGPDVLLIAGLSDPAEAWTFQLDGLADQYRMTAFDNRGAGRSPMPPQSWSVAGMADDAAEILQRAGHRQCPRLRVLRRQLHSTGAGAAPSRAGAQPRARQHVGQERRLPPGHDVGVDLAAGCCAERAGDARGVLHVDLHTARPRERDGRRDHRGGAGLPPPAVAGGVHPPARGVDPSRHVRPVA